MGQDPPSPWGQAHVILPALAFLEALNRTYLPFYKDFMEEGWFIIDLR